MLCISVSECVLHTMFTCQKGGKNMQKKSLKTFKKGAYQCLGATSEPWLTPK